MRDINADMDSGQRRLEARVAELRNEAKADKKALCDGIRAEWAQACYMLCAKAGSCKSSASVH